MKSPSSFAKQVLHGLCAMLTLAAFTAGLAATAQSYKVIHEFAFTGLSHFGDGANPTSNLIFDTHGNLFGVTVEGGDNKNTGCNFGCGTVFELSRTPAGGWKETELHRFHNSIVGNNNDGTSPQGPLILDSAGNLYGTASDIVFELSPTSSGGWTYNILHTFTGADGQGLVGRLALDASGNLFGTTQGGGSSLFGVVFELSPSSTGWSETVLYNFSGTSDGAYPNSGVVFDPSGNLYGTTSYGGTGSDYLGFGVAFKLSPSAQGWTETVLHTFSGAADGAFPFGSVTLDASGNLYGTTAAGGIVSGCKVNGNGPGCGVVYQLSPSTGGTWTENVLYTFLPGTGSMGGYGGGVPFSGVTLDSAGNLYGTTSLGGRTTAKFGVVYELSPSSGAWTEKVLHAFYGGTDGGTPYAGITLDPAGNLFGMASAEGIKADCSNFGGCGTVFEITP